MSQNGYYLKTEAMFRFNLTYFPTGAKLVPVFVCLYPLLGKKFNDIII